MIPRFFLSSKTSNSYNFSVHTVNVCNPKSSDCVIEDKKLNVFDLRPLHKKEENWQVIGRKSNESAVLFCLNVCGPVNQNTDCNCPPGPIGACQAGRSTSLSKNIGYITSDPVANDDGSLTLMYTGGDSCRDGVRTSSTRISFICSEVDYPPVFLRVSDSCEHLFAWHTPAACPVNVVRSKTCQVTDPFFGHTFDLNVLRNDTWDYRVTNGNLDFLVNVCGPLVAPCGGRQGTTAVCELGVEQRSGGEVPAELVFNDGTLMMTFSDGAVGCGSRWRSQVLFLCSHNDEGLEGLQYLHADESACVHHFIWHTTHACPPHTEVDCSVSDGDLTYDLTPLSNPNMNEIFITYGRGKKYVLNVCRSVIHSKDSRCAYDAGACVIDMNHENSSLSLGKVEAGPYVDDGVLMVKYKDGDACNGSHAYTTIIEFECTDKQYLSYPILYAEEDCTMFFKWSTVFACPKNTSSTLEDSLHNCTAINPLTNYVFDMNSLTKPNKPHELSITEGVTLLVSACGAVNDTRCPAGSGACVVGRNGAKSSAGKANKELRFRTWSTYLEYSGGEECANGFKRSTRISFICQEGETVSGPILISDDIDSCIFFVNWYTESACERHIRCFAHNFDRTFDLSPLIRNWGNYEVRDPTNPNSTYLLNVCRPLNPVIGVNCHPGSSSCLVRKNEPPLGLGHPILNPTVVGGDEVHLMYAHGSACPTDPELPLSSRIIFICNRTAGAGTPRFFKKSFECQIQFEWPTSLVCPPIVSEGAQCQIAFEPAKTNVDLTSLKGTTPYRVTHRGHSYLLNLCGANACGNNSAVCSDDGTSFGRSDQTKLQWDGPALQLSFYGGGLCEGAISGSRSARIFFKCDQSAGFGTPVVDPLTYNPNLHCIVVFSWRTNLTCLEAPYPDSSPTSRPAPNSTSTTRPAPSSRNPTPFTPTSAPHREDEDTMSEHTWVSAAVAVCVVVGVAAVVVWVAGRSTRGRRWLGRAKRALVRKGYANPAESDNLLQQDPAFVYRVDEDEHVLRV